MSKTLDVLWRDRFALENPALEGEAADPAVEKLLAHRTQRLYTDRPVPAAILDTLLAAALSAASKSDLQQVSMIRIRDRAIREARHPGAPGLRGRMRGRSPAWLRPGASCGRRWRRANGSDRRERRRSARA